MPLFPFAQFEVAGRFPIADGRYLARDSESGAEDVLVISSLQVPRRERRRRPRRARDAGDAPKVEPLPVIRATVVRTAGFDDAGAAESWLAEMRRDPAARDEFTGAALRLVNTALHAHRAVAMDPYVCELGPHAAIATRVGFGDGDELVAGRWSAALDAPPDPVRRRRRAETLFPQERLAAVLTGRERLDVCETLVLRARLDLDQGRPREAALQLEPAIRALLAEVHASEGTDQAEDLARLEGRRRQIADAGEKALAGDLPAELEAALGDSLAVGERVLRRRRLLGRGV
jgi:hypothetical protein